MPYDCPLVGVKAAEIDPGTGLGASAGRSRPIFATNGGLNLELFVVKKGHVKDVAPVQKDGYPNQHGGQSVDGHAASNKVGFGPVLSRYDALEAQRDTDAAKDGITASSELVFTHPVLRYLLKTRRSLRQVTKVMTVFVYWGSVTLDKVRTLPVAWWWSDGPSVGDSGPFTITRMAPRDDSFPRQSRRNPHRRLYGTPKIFTGRFIV